MTDKRTLGIRPDGWRMTRNDNLYCCYANYRITTVQIAGKAKSENMRLYGCKLTALELKMLPAVNGV